MLQKKLLLFCSFFTCPIILFTSISMEYICPVSVWWDSKNRSLPFTTPINMTSRKHIGIINHSVTCFKILSFSSRWQHGLPLIPFIRIPSHLCLAQGITFCGWNVWWKIESRAKTLLVKHFFWWITVMLALLSLRGMSRFDIVTLSPPAQ